MSGLYHPGRLLQDLALALALPYLSDLHDPRYYMPIYSMLSSLPAAQYRPEEWRTAAQYILSDHASAFSDPREQLLCTLQSAILHSVDKQ